MLALRISVNGRLLVVAGTAGTASVNLDVRAMGEALRLAKPGHGPVTLRLGGLSDDGEGVRRSLLSWIDELGCSVGDEIVIRVVEAGETEIASPVRTAIPAGVEKMLVPASPFKNWLATLFVKKGGPNAD